MVTVRKKDEKKKVPAPSEKRLAAIELTLASRGVDYGETVPGGVIQIRPPLFSEVKYFAQLNAENFQSNITELIKQLLIDSRIDPLDLTTGDRSHLHLWIRGQVDPYYRLSIICPACSFINNGYDFPISEIPIKPAPEEYSSPFEIELPDSKSKIVLQLETGRDAVKRVEMVSSGVADYDARHALAVVSVDGKRWVQTKL